MPKLTVSIVDYGAGNMFSIARALEYLGLKVEFVSTPESIRTATRLILPGVGAYSDAMKVLKNRELIAPIKEYVIQQKPMLGICLGMQLLFDFSEEHGHTQGFGFISGSVKAIPPYGDKMQTHKIPHIGWRALSLTQSPTSCNLFHSINPEDEFYFIHSFQAQPYNENNILAYCDYNGLKICSAVQSGNLYGVQFHPEKSRENGLSLLSNFIAQKH